MQGRRAATDTDPSETCDLGEYKETTQTGGGASPNVR